MTNKNISTYQKGKKLLEIMFQRKKRVHVGGGEAICNNNITII